MGFRDASYVIFDGDNDKWAYTFMQGWKSNENVDFDFEDAHDLDNMTSRAQGEVYVKARLTERMKKASAVIVLIGDSTKNLYRFVRWELDLALELGLPIIAVNLNGSRSQDNLVPPIIRDKCVVHTSFKMKIIQHALDQWPNEFYSLEMDQKNSVRYYNDAVYESLSI